jgi:hypothetical protein
VRVRARIRYSQGSLGAAVDSAPSTGLSPAVVTFRPNKPGTPSVSAGVRSIHAVWTAPVASVAPVTDYIVQYSLASPIAWKTFVDPVSASPVAHISGLTPGKAYVVRVIAKNKFGNGAASANSAARVPLA